MGENTELLKLLPVAVYLTDAEGRLTFYNDAAADLWGCRPELGTTRWCGSWRLYWPDGSPMAHDECPMAVTLKEGRAVRGAEAIAERPDGTRVPFVPYPTPLRDPSGRLTGAMNLLVDISDRNYSELESAKLAAIVTSSDDAIISKTIQGRITSWNTAATRLFGYEPSEIIGKPITTIIPPELHDEEKEIIARLRRGERIDHYETVRVAKNGRRIELSLSVSPLRDKWGNVVGAAKVARDITERKRAEYLQQLLLEELNHRVKNTLSTIQAMATQSLRHTTSPEAFVSAFSGRVQALSRAHEVLTESKLQGADVMRLVREQVLLGNVPDARVQCSGPAVMLDAQTALHLALVLHELATNARKYGALSASEGRLSVSWELRRNGGAELLLEWKESGGPLVAAPSHRGFGSTLIERTIQAHGGKATMRYASEGLTARIKLPLAPTSSRASEIAAALGEKAPQALVQHSARKETLRGKQIVIIEDEALVLMDLEANLTDAGCEVVGTAGTIADGKELSARAVCDAALLDANLAGHPVDEIAAALSQRNIPFAFVTGYGPESLPSGFRDAMMLKKPFSQKDLLSVLDILLNGSSGVVPLRRNSAADVRGKRALT